MNVRLVLLHGFATTPDSLTPKGHKIREVGAVPEAQPLADGPALHLREGPAGRCHTPRPQPTDGRPNQKAGDHLLQGMVAKIDA